MSFKLTVNGKSSTVDVPADMPLLWVLRDVLNLRGTKYGCGIGQCGACTVHLNGKAVRSCLTPVSAAAKAPITTIEGLSADGTHPRAGGLAGYRRAAMRILPGGTDDVGRGAARSKPAPTDQDIDSAMNGNLCRCGTYLRIRAAIHKAAAMSAGITG